MGPVMVIWEVVHIAVPFSSISLMHTYIVKKQQQQQQKESPDTIIFR